MSRILLTNDDGVDSPALVPFARALGTRHEVRVVVPERERSWISKAITRYEDITLRRDQRGGLEVHTTSGTPADAAQLGLYAVAVDTDVVISGVNLGFNHGTAFMLSSGTVGAAIEGWLTGRPSIAFSTGTWGSDWSAWYEQIHEPESAPAWDRLAHLAVDLLTDVLDSGLAETADVVSINVPFEADADTPRRVTRLGRVGYGNLFGRVGEDRWRHQAVNVEHLDDPAGTDVEAAGEHVITITPVRMPASPPVSPDLRARLERP